MSTDYESLLKGTHWKTQADEQDAATLADSQQAVSDAASKVFITIDRIGRRIHSGFGTDEAVEANEAVTTFLTRLNDMLVGNGGQITASFAGSNTGGADEAHVQELESRADEAERQLAAVQGNQDDLRRNARRASDLQIALDEARREVARLENDVTSLTQENAQLSAQRATAHTQRVRELEDEVASLREQLSEARSALEVEQAEHDLTRQQLENANAATLAANGEYDRAVDNANAWKATAETAQQRVTEVEAELSEANARASRWFYEAEQRGYIDQPDEPHGSDDSSTDGQPAAYDEAGRPARPVVDPSIVPGFGGSDPSDTTVMPPLPPRPLPRRRRGRDRDAVRRDRRQS